MNTYNKAERVIDTENRWVVDRGGGCSRDEMGECGQKVQISSYKISHGNVMYSMVTMVNNTVLYV